MARINSPNAVRYVRPMPMVNGYARTVAGTMVMASVETSRKMRWCHACGVQIPRLTTHLAARQFHNRRYIRRNYCKECGPIVVREMQALCEDIHGQLLAGLVPNPAPQTYSENSTLYTAPPIPATPPKTYKKPEGYIYSSKGGPF